MNHIVIGIPTYKRPEMLEKLIRSIYSCEVKRKLLKSIDIVVVDNDAEKSAEKISLGLKKECPELFSFHYYNCPKKGLALVRNEILDKALEFRPDLIAFIDDDEYPSRYWLTELIETLNENNADIVLGPNTPVFENKVHPNFAHLFDTLEFADNTEVDFVKTNNLIIKSDFVRAHKLRFDSRFNQTGGEDTYFGVEAVKAGAKIFWSQGAVVHEIIPDKRATLNWLTKRAYRGATTYTYILKLEKNYQGLAKKFMTSLVYLLIGIFTLPLILLPIKHRYWGFFKICNALGGLAGLFNIRYKEYASPKTLSPTN